MKSILSQMLQEALKNEPLNEMSNLMKSDTGLPVIVWFCGETEVEHNLPRIKFQNNYSNKIQKSELVPMSISNEPEILINIKLNIKQKDIDKIKEWVKLNKNTLLDYWNYKISTRHALEKFINV